MAGTKARYPYEVRKLSEGSSPLPWTLEISKKREPWWCLKRAMARLVFWERWGGRGWWGRQVGPWLRNETSQNSEWPEGSDVGRGPRDLDLRKEQAILWEQKTDCWNLCGCEQKEACRYPNGGWWRAYPGPKCLQCGDSKVICWDIKRGP